VARSGEVPDVLKDEELRAAGEDDRHDVEEQRPSSPVPEALLLAGLRERLAREARAQHVVLGNSSPDLLRIELGSVRVRPFTGQRPDVRLNRFCSHVRERRPIHTAALLIELDCEHALATEWLQRMVESADAGEQVDEPEGRLDRTRVRHAS